MLDRCHSHQHQPSVLGFPRDTEIRPAGEEHGWIETRPAPCISPEGRISVSPPRPKDPARPP